MILVTHAVIGAALTNRIGNLVSVFIVAFISHYIFDMIPHWHYPTPKIIKALTKPAGEKTISISPVYFSDFARILIDLILGLVVVWAFFDMSLTTIIVAVFGAVLPDLMAGFARIWPQKLLVLHSRFHRWVHTDIRLDDKHLLGIGTQLGLSLLLILLFR
jgi:hypothetical protein